ncbi:CGNR zinc finger domain-containing protein [Candidatus Manganitrophus noduliformans]|uniref:CGNR zinc finger domain-containing protein n=1 Tax=Candidatus Manganitrophus noduliformans TaxID=2606439 RepID=A0A7X6IBB0_9BACT|nr:CGNR zinc finger domain-containing protein [Candidatus Manganitrophus noduliformans]NKE71260.1 CGNR zinc finger domain-containing protein [Candidatus Manganitrophus noduliformans]
MDDATFPKFEGVWWRGKVEVDRGFIIEPVEEELIQYNPFDFYFPQGKATREQRSLPYLFLDVNADNIEDVAAFSQRFGVLGDEKKFRNPNWFKTLFPPPDETPKEGLLLMKIPPETQRIEDLGLTAEDFLRIQRWTPSGQTPDKDLCAPMQIGTFKNAQQAIRIAVDLHRASTESSDRVKAEAMRSLLGTMISGKLAAVRPRLAWDSLSQQWITHWDTWSLVGAMYLMLLFDIQGRGNILTCPWCKRFFLGDHSRTQYCSPNCQNSAKVNRYRKRMSVQEGKKETSKKKKGGTDGKKKQRESRTV